MFDSVRAVLCATMTILAGGATVSAGTIIEIPQYQRVQISWSGSTGCHSASWWHQPTAMHGGWCTLNTLTYTYSGKRISMWSFDLSGIPADAEITSLAIRVSGGEGYYSAEGQLFNLGLKTGAGILSSNDGSALYGQGVLLGQPAPFEEGEYVLSTSEIIEARDDTGWLVAGVSWPYGAGVEGYSYLGPNATLLVEYEDEPCPGDTDGSGTVDVTDLLAVISGWGPCIVCDADIDESGAVDVGDLLAVLDSWGACP